MYVPAFNLVNDESEVRAMVDAIGSAEFITMGDDGYPLSTLLPIMWHGNTVIAHMARANPQWQSIKEATPTLLVCAGPQAYISPSWYPAKAEHGRVVPTWNYSAVHLTGTTRLHEDSQWLRQAVAKLVDVHEGERKAPWGIGDAPAAYIDGQLRGIVGLEMTVERVEGKAKLSQNRSEADQRGVVEGLRADGGDGPQAIAEVMIAAIESTG